MSDNKNDKARQEAHANSQRMTTAFDDGGGGASNEKNKDGLLFSLSVETVKMDHFKKMRNAEK